MTPPVYSAPASTPLAWPRRQFLGAGLAASSLALPAFSAEPAAATGFADPRGGFVGPSPERGHLLRGASPNAEPSSTRRVGVLIAGGGVAGLAAARALRLRGITDVALLELEDQAGGNSRAASAPGSACPLGAHYLPVPGPGAPEVQALLHELGLLDRQGNAGYQVSAAGERHLCHSPQERLFFNGAWQEGLLPLAGVGAATLAQYQRFAQAIALLEQQAKFNMPVSNTPLAPIQIALDAITFDIWLAGQGLHDAHLRWYLNYCCRDEYGAGTGVVSAYAGIAYFAARHGFTAPSKTLLPRPAPSEALLPRPAPSEALTPRTSPSEALDSKLANPSLGLFTWPEGNAWLTQRLAGPLAERLHTGQVVLRIAETKGGVEVDALNVATQQVVRWQALHGIVCLPLLAASRIVQLRSKGLQSALQAAAARTVYAPWLVANLHLKAPLRDRGGAAPAWDNVLYGAPGLGYVDARHQGLQMPRRGEAAVLTYYRSFADPLAARQQLLAQPWTHWREAILAELGTAHPDLASKLQHTAICRWGHGMAIPLPGAQQQRILHSQIGLLPRLNERGQLLKKEQSKVATSSPRIQFAHSDWAGYSVFEEAFTLGHRAGMAAML